VEIAAYLVTAVLVEGQSVRQVAKDHGVSKTRVYELLARYGAERETGLIPRYWSVTDDSLDGCGHQLPPVSTVSRVLVLISVLTGRPDPQSVVSIQRYRRWSRKDP
jgi:hypothetical protein